MRITRRDIGDVIAMKRPLPQQDKEPEHRALRRLAEFLREAVNHMQIRTPQVLQFLGWGEDESGLPAVFTELCLGDTLHKFTR